MKTRSARSFESAITSIIEAIGAEACADAVGRSPSLIRKWSDPDNPAQPSISQAVMLDTAFLLKTGQPAPIRAVYGYMIEASYDDAISEREPLIVALFNLHASIGGLTRLIADTMEATSDQGGSLQNLQLTPRLRETILSALENVGKELADLETATRSHHVK